MGAKQFLRAAFARQVLSRRFGHEANWNAANALTFYPGLGLAYNRIKKNANTTTVILLREMDTGRVEDRGVAKDNSLKFSTLPFSKSLTLRDYFYFVTVRNPYSRVLSAFLQKFQLGDYQEKYDRFEVTAHGFEKFVRWLGDGGLEKDGHWDLQVRQMFLPPAQYDAVVRMENFEPEMTALFERNGLVPPQGRLQGLYPSDINKKTSADRKLREFYLPATIDLVADLYGRDFETLGYSRDFTGDTASLPR